MPDSPSKVPLSQPYGADVEGVFPQLPRVVLVDNKLLIPPSPRESN